MLWALILIVGLSSTLAHAGDVSFTYTWQANSEQDLAGYRLYRSAVSGQYTQPPVSIVGATTYRVTVPQTAEEQNIYAVLTAINLAGKESPRSNEVRKTIPAMPSSTGSVDPPVVEPPVVAPPVEVWPTAALTLKALSSSELEVGYPTLPEPYKLDIRLMPSPLQWGSAPSLACALGTCRASNLIADTLHGAVAVVYRGTLNQDAVFGPFTPVVETKTMTAQIIVPPVIIPPVTGLRIQSATPDEIVISAPKSDCSKITTSTVGSTATVLKRTIRCVK